jgi:hypothetical protein
VKGGRAMGAHKITKVHREQFANQIKARSKRGSITKSMREKGVAAVGHQRWHLAEDIFNNFIGVHLLALFCTFAKECCVLGH